MDAAAVRRHLQAAHQPTLDAVAECLDAVAESLDLPASRAAVVARQDRALESGDLKDPLVGLLESALGASGAEPEAPIVAAPPYLVVTGRGPMLRATAGGERLVVLLQGFELDGNSRYLATDEFRVDVTVREP